ncbi:vitamin B12-dependent ribonucleotide reductase [Rhodopirellula sp. MGV]|uniref:vitamin B12-dependent ribonucleotide reductase n=1 Tax=Rhodopirellula sp. MGV TaxID=2023130 RepID=UPI000B9795AB|nr:vitamin B12-dependent ribonucleotide reductase [Rhodopirellula sp. MGV]OYP35704.1 ribonucleoside-diphosphate reductase, adenosylcobalamin-dependent [Rhodopirellula sp. MGV]PNY35000.1 ribonucleoside-diphosphate reductase, adenosylcobalamin-dependent [Rhodopirellula baltica]
MATVLPESSRAASGGDAALEKVNNQHGVQYATEVFGTTLRGDRPGLKVEPTFCPADGKTPFDTAQWEIRSAAIKDESGKALFEQNNCEVPTTWSQLATNVVVSKYFYGDPKNTDERERSVRQLIHRVTRTIADWGLADGYFDTPEDGENFYRDLTWLCLHQHGAFNSPVWFNVGLHHQYGVTGAKCNWAWDRTEGETFQPENPYEFPQGSACFIQAVGDNMEDIMRLACAEAMLFKFGSGTGTDLSTIRSSKEKLSGGGTPSGPLSFMRVYDSIAGVVKSGGKTRRAAKMQSLKVWHPDILEFIECKWSEEKKAHALIREGYDSNFNGEAYSSVCFQNANLSVRVTDDYMEAVREGKRWQTRWVTDKVAGDPPSYDAKELLNKMSECAWHCGDPGVQYDTTINKWHTCPNSGAINASNPCSEYMFLDNTACNLASINLMKFANRDGSFDVKRFRAASRLFFIAQEILVDHASYPTEPIARNSHRFRPLGLGYSNLGSLVMSRGLAYDSKAARGLCGSLTSLLHGEANRTSAEMAGVVGPFDDYAENEKPMLNVMRMHRDAANEIDEDGPAELKEAAKKLWDDVLDIGERYGFRNAQATVLAPTGTISFMMDCDTTGIEPDIALVKYKQLAGGGMLKIVNQTVAPALSHLGYTPEQIEVILAYIDVNDTIEGAPELKAEHLSVFDCAFTPANGIRSISWRAHVTMMAAAQPFLSGAISKTVNMPHDTTPADIADAYYWGWELGLKAIAIYRDGSKQSQPLNTKSDEGKSTKTETKVVTKTVEKIVYKPRRERLPDTRTSITHKFTIAGHEGYLCVGQYPDGRPGEVFITMAKEGSTVGGIMDSFGTALSIALQYGVPLEVLVNKFSHTRFEPMGHTSNKDIRIAKSVVDYIARWLGLTFMSNDDSMPANGHVPSNDSVNSGNSAEVATVESTIATNERAGLLASINGNGSNGSSKKEDNRQEQFARFQIDAPSCDNCGSITVRNGNCYLCHNCGASMGCS